MGHYGDDFDDGWSVLKGCVEHSQLMMRTWTVMVEGAKEVLPKDACFREKAEASQMGAVILTASNSNAKASASAIGEMKMMNGGMGEQTRWLPCWERYALAIWASH